MVENLTNVAQQKTKRARTNYFSIFIIFIVVLFLTSPDEEKYVSWLKEQHGITCENNYDCYDHFNNKKITFRSQGVRDGYLLFSLIDTTFIDETQTNEREIKAIGILSTYFTIK
jgi:hypothetical protein